MGLEYEPFSNTVHALANSPPYSLGDDTELMDVNADGLPDVIDMTPRRYSGGHGAFLNQAAQSAMGFSKAKVINVGDQVPGVDGGVLRLTNRNVRPMDADGDGHIDLVHMPSNEAFSVFSIEQSEGLRWVGRTTQVERPSRRLDLSQGAHRSVVADVNSDGLVDLLVTTATEYQVYLALGRFPGGDGRFGSGKWTGPDTAELSVEPLRTCVPWSAKPILLGDDGVQLAEMNGDGLLDLVLLKSGKVQYWPGRGDGVFGTGDKQDCRAGDFATERHVQMTNPPRFGTTAGGPLLVNDINADGLGDLIEVHRDSVSLYLNEDGHGWTDRVTLDDTPVIPAGLNTVRLADIFW
jgi:hypothetical protein